MSIRYLSNLVLAVMAGFLVVATQAFAPGAVAWITFGVAIGIVVVGLAMAAGIRDRTQRGIGGLAVAVGAWTIVASLVFAPTTVVWLGFASALAVVGLALAGLTAHELTTERVVHSLEVAPETARRRDPIAA